MKKIDFFFLKFSDNDYLSGVGLNTLSGNQNPASPAKRWPRNHGRKGRDDDQETSGDMTLRMN